MASTRQDHDIDLLIKEFNSYWDTPCRVIIQNMQSGNPLAFNHFQDLINLERQEDIIFIKQYHDYLQEKIKSNNVATTYALEFLGSYYYYVVYDYSRAQVYLELAAKQDSSIAKFILAFMFIHGQYVPITNNIRSGDSDRMDQLGRSLLAEAVNKDVPQALMLQSDICGRDIRNLEIHRSWDFSDPVLEEKIAALMQESRAAYSKASELGLSKAMLRLYGYNKHEKKDDQSALENLYRAIRFGSSMALSILGNLLLQGDDVNARQAITCFQLAGDKGHAESSGIAGVIFQEGRYATKADLGMAKKYYLQAIKAWRGEAGGWPETSFRSIQEIYKAHAEWDILANFYFDIIMRGVNYIAQGRSRKHYPIFSNSLSGLAELYNAHPNNQRCLSNIIELNEHSWRSIKTKLHYELEEKISHYRG